eukprot:12668294-Heterocapsa_arctica.AAC.1
MDTPRINLCLRNFRRRCISLTTKQEKLPCPRGQTGNTSLVKRGPCCQAGCWRGIKDRGTFGL